MHKEIVIQCYQQTKIGDYISHLFKKIMFGIIHIALLVFIIYSFYTDYTTEKNLSVEYNNRIVREGETLWSISSEFQPDHLSRWEYIYLISEKNEMKNLNIKAGEVIEIPIFK